MLGTLSHIKQHCNLKLFSPSFSHLLPMPACHLPIYHSSQLARGRGKAGTDPGTDRHVAGWHSLKAGRQPCLPFPKTKTDNHQLIQLHPSSIHPSHITIPSGFSTSLLLLLFFLCLPISLTLHRHFSLLLCPYTIIHCMPATMPCFLTPNPFCLLQPYACL